MTGTNLQEIRGDPVLRAYGACLAGTHVLTFLFWCTTIPLVPILGPAGEVICWPFLPHCDAWRVLSAEQWRLILWGYLAISVVSVALFARPGWTRAAWWTLLIVNGVKLAIVLQDFQLRQNQH